MNITQLNLEAPIYNNGYTADTNERANNKNTSPNKALLAAFGGLAVLGIAGVCICKAARNGTKNT